MVIPFIGRRLGSWSPCRRTAGAARSIVGSRAKGTGVGERHARKTLVIAAVVKATIRSGTAGLPPAMSVGLDCSSVHVDRLLNTIISPWFWCKL